MELATKGTFDEIGDETLQAEVEASWDAKVTKEYDRLSSLASDAVPKIRAWPNYAMRSIAAIRASVRIAQRRQKVTTGTGFHVEAEVPVAGFADRLRGKIDLVIRGADDVLVLDYKSGTVLDGTQGAGELKAAYVRQLHLYAALYHARFGDWPTHLVLESLIDGRHELPFDKEVANQAAEAAIERLASFNDSVAAGGIAGAPSIEHCRWCSYKAICLSFLSGATEEWELPGVSTVGVIEGVFAGDQPRVSLHTEGGNHPTGVATVVRGLPDQLVSEVVGHEGERISFSDLRRIPGTPDLWFQWSSTCWLWEEG